MKHRRGADIESFVRRTAEGQRNIVWPDPLAHSRAVDVFLWRGSPNPTMVQRIAAWIMGFSFIAVGLGCLSLTWLDGTWSLGPLTIGALGLFGVIVGIKIFSSGWRRRTHPIRDPER